MVFDTGWAVYPPVLWANVNTCLGNLQDEYNMERMIDLDAWPEPGAGTVTYACSATLRMYVGESAKIDMGMRACCNAIDPASAGRSYDYCCSLVVPLLVAQADWIRSHWGENADWSEGTVLQPVLSKGELAVANNNNAQKDEKVDLQPGNDLLARIRYSEGATLNVGNYESRRVDIGIELPCRRAKDSMDNVYEWCRQWVRRRLQEEAEKLRGMDL